MNRFCTAAFVPFVLAIAGNASAITVEEAVAAGCTTKQVEGLSLQIIGQGNCIEKGAYVEVPTKANATFGSAVLPYIQQPAQEALVAALDDNGGQQMQINSMLRTVAQQYLLYRWYQLGTCGIGLAATPGSSNHESGLAIDIQQYDAWRTALEAKGFKWFGSGDPVHFDYAGPGVQDFKGNDVLAFQQLWNKNNPGDVIDEDGLYGPQTEGRLKQTSADGFVIGPDDCDDPPPGGESKIAISAKFATASDVFDDGPSKGVTDLFEGDDYKLEVTVSNTGDATSGALELTATATACTLESSTSIDAIEPGEETLLILDVTETEYSVTASEAATIALAIGDAKASRDIDVYSHSRWEFDGGRLEGWTSDSALAAADGVLALTSPMATASLRITDLDLAADEILLSAKRGASAGAAMLWVTDDEGGEQSLPLEIAADGSLTEIVIPAESLPARFVALRIEPFHGATSAEEATFELDYLRVGPLDLTVPGGNTGCVCEASSQGSPRGLPAFFALFFVAMLRPQAKCAPSSGPGPDGRRR